ncbi:MAG: cupredoxin domain-containing protein [Solirubrobacterales bacterium]
MRGPRRIAVAGVLAACLLAPPAILARGPSQTAGGVGPPDTARQATTPSGPVASGASGPVASGAGSVASGASGPVASGAGSVASLARTAIADAVAAPIGAQRATASAVAAASVSIVNYAYNPKTVTIDAGETVKWTNNDKDVPEGHTVTGDGFDSGVLDPGQTYSREFARSGTYDYFCTLHPGMKGKVVVRKASGGGNGGGGGGGNSGGGNGGGDGGGSGSGGADANTSGTGGAATSGASPPPESGSSSLPLTGQDLLILALVGLDVLLAGAWLAVRLRSAR